MKRAIAVSLLFTAYLGRATADQPNETLPGFRPENVFESHGTDNVNLFNGDPGVVIPLGGEYVLGPQYGWQLKAYYSAKFWAMSTCGVETHFANLRGDPTIGVGWTLQLGYVTTGPGVVVYFSPDGGIHRVSNLGTQVTTDGTHLRITPLTNSYRVEFPDGSVQTFDKPFSPPLPIAGTSKDFGNGLSVATRYGLSSIKDQFGNTLLTVSYVGTTWQVSSIILTPSTQSRTITFNWKPGGFAVPPLTWPVLDSIDFPAPSGRTLRTTFAYSAATFDRNSYDNSNNQFAQCPPPSPFQVAVPELDSITFSDLVVPPTQPSFIAFSYNFSYPDLHKSGGVELQGALRQITLPTGGTISYDYGTTTQTFQETFDVGGCGGDPEVEETCGGAPVTTSNCLVHFNAFLDKSIAVTRRTEADAGTGLTSTIDYVRAGWVPPDSSGMCANTRLIVRRTTVRSPGNDLTGPAVYAMRVYFHVAAIDDSDDQLEDGGIELDRRYYRNNCTFPDTVSPTHCPGEAAQAPVRSVISCYGDALYGRGPFCGYRGATGQIVGYNFQNLPPKQAEVTWFGVAPGPNESSDGGTCSTAFTTKCTRWAGTNLSLPAAKYRDITTTSTLQAAPGWTSRAATTNWTPQTGSFWDLDLFSSKTIADNGTSLPLPTNVTTGYTFNTANGFLISVSTTDGTYGTVTHTFGHDPAWNTNSEAVAGTGSGLSMTTFTDTNTFQAFLPLIAQRTAITWKSFDVDRETNRGLITTSREPNVLLAASYTYDALGRLKSVAPAGSEAVTSITYDSTTQTTVIRSDTSQRYKYDGFGRLSREIRRMAAGYSVRTRKYDKAGHPYFVSERASCTSATGDCLTVNPGGTTQSNFDPFGRAQTITKADGTVTTISRTDGGINFSDSREAVTETVSGNPATTARRRDPLGRNISVAEPPNADVTSYMYNVLDKVTCVEQGGTGQGDTTCANSGGQVRSFSYDSFGFLRAQNTPEGGLVTYSSYDALGDVLTEADPGPLMVSRVYDAAARLQKVTASGLVYVRNCYDGTSVACIDGVAGFAGGTNPKGRLTRRYGYNPSSTPAATITEDFTYSNAAGRLSSQTTAFSNGLTFSATQSWGYNSLGLLSSYSHAKQPTGTVLYETDYFQGFPVTIRQDGTSTLISTVTYQPTGAVASWNAANGVLTTIDQDLSLMARPREIKVTKNPGPVTLFDSGIYTYDGAGNIAAIGNDNFGYDPRSRITEANYPDALIQRQLERQLYSYDLYGNLVSRSNVSGDSVTTDVFCSGTCVNNQMLFSSYDARGNLTNGGAVYDGLSRLRLLPSGGNWVYLFNGSNERIAKVPPAGTANTIYTLRNPANRVATEYVGTTLGRDNLYLGNLLVASRSWNVVAGPVGLTFYHSDHLGSPRIVTDGAAAVVDSRKFWPFGGEVQNQGAPVQRLGFASMERDSEVTKRYYDHARHEDGFWGRFLSPDKLLGRVSSPQTWNRYTYAGNNPIKYVDRTGLDFVLTGCNGGPEATCNQQKQLLRQTVGDKAYSYLSVGKDGKVMFNGITAGAFGKQFGVFGRALAGLVDSKSVFSLFTNNPAKAAMGGGAFTDVLKGGGANIYLNPSSFPKEVGGAETSLAIAFAHEAGGHAAASLFPELRDAISSRTSNSVRTYLSGEGYSVTFENRYRQEVGADIRSYYLEPGDYIPPRPGLNLFPPSFP